MGCGNSKQEIKVMKQILKQLEIFSTEMIRCRNEVMDLNKKIDNHLSETIPYKCIALN